MADSGGRPTGDIGLCHAGPTHRSLLEAPQAISRPQLDRMGGSCYVCLGLHPCFPSPGRVGHTQGSPGALGGRSRTGYVDAARRVRRGRVDQHADRTPAPKERGGSSPDSAVRTIHTVL